MVVAGCRIPAGGMIYGECTARIMSWHIKWRMAEAIPAKAGGGSATMAMGGALRRHL